jgi:hypothetical protein
MSFIAPMARAAASIATKAVPMIEDATSEGQASRMASFAQGNTDHENMPKTRPQPVSDMKSVTSEVM